MQDNADSIQAAEERGTTPYFVRDNKEYIDSILKPAEGSYEANNNASTQKIKKTPLEIAAERHGSRTPERIEEIQTRWNSNRMLHLLENAERIGSFKDDTFTELYRILMDDNSLSDFGAFRHDYSVAKEYVRTKIDEQTMLARRFMKDPTNVENMQKLAKALGVTQGDYMTFFEANELRGNPNYFKSEGYRINCQTSVVAHELRRRGFNIEALANTKGSWLEALSHHTEEIWMDANGAIPTKTIIGAKKIVRTNRYTGKSWYEWEKTVPNRKQLISALEATITKDGRYYVDWTWDSQGEKLKGHIITLEKIGNNLMYYDPQNGQIINDFYNYISDIKLSRGIRFLRVDNLRIRADYATHILGKSGSKIVDGVIGKSGIRGKISYKERDEVLKSDRFKTYADNTPLSNLRTGVIKRQGKSRKYLLKHCYKSESIEAAEYIWEHPEELKFKRKSKLGENKDMTLQKNIDNVEKKKKRGVLFYNEYSFVFNGKEWQIGMEVYRKGYEQMYYIK